MVENILKDKAPVYIIDMECLFNTKYSQTVFRINFNDLFKLG